MPTTCSNVCRPEKMAATQAQAKDTQRLKWFIRGMDCASCAAKVEKGLSGVKGVRQVRIAFATERLMVDLEQGGDSSRIHSIVREMGYTLEDTDQTEQEKPIWKSHSTITLLTALITVATTLRLIDPQLGAISFTLGTVIGVIPFARKAWSQIKNGTWFGIASLMTVAALGALVLGETVEAVLVLFLFSLGEMLEGFAGQKAKAGIKNLMQLTPDTAIQINGDKRIEVPADFLQPGEIIEVRPGDRLPVDGEILSTLGIFNESVLTGESMPAQREQGETVMAGSLVIDQPVRVKVTSEPGKNAIDRIITLIEDAESRKAPIARMIDEFSAWYTPLVMVGALLVMIIPPLFFGAPWESSAYKALALLLIACPCALVVSIPAAVTSALASAARFGALIKGGAALEQLRLINKLAFDKTGTLTEGKPQVTRVIAIGVMEENLLAMAAAVEQGSSHPLAKAIIEAAENKNLSIPPTDSVRVLTGRGVEGVIENRALQILAPRYVVPELLKSQQVNIERLESEGSTVVVIIDNGQVLGLIALADTLREDAAEGIARLKEIGVNCVMLTGDNRRTAAAIAGKLGIDYQAELLPEDKVNAITSLQADNHGGVAMVGDGINDAPALKAAEIGIAMGRGSDVALETADAALTHERLVQLANMISLSKDTAKITRQNIALALGINTLFLITTLFGVTGLMAAVLSDAGGTVLVTLNALRLMQKRD